MKIEKSLAHRVIDGQAFVMDPAHKRLHSLNPAGTSIWKGLAAGRSPDELARGLAEEFDVEPRRARADVDVFVTELRRLHLVD